MSENVNASMISLTEKELSKSKFGLNFHPKLEELYIRENATKLARQTIIASVVCLLLFNFFLIEDYVFRSDVFWTAAMLRLGALTLPAIIFLYIVKAGVSEKLRNIILVGGSINLTLVAVFVGWISTGETVQFDPFTFILVIIGINITLPLRFNYALAASTTCALIVSAYGIMREEINGIGIQILMMTLASTTIYTLIANYRLEKSVRESYLRAKLQELKSNDMAETNRRLVHISSTDPLTGVANRRAFDQAYSDIWDTQLETQQPIAILMIDIDHFKSFNDTYGHLAGDACLKRVANSISEQIRANSDLVARLGGEEFCVLLPGAPAQRAQKIAERIRQSVAAIEITATASHDPAPVTVSIGISVGVPTIDDNRDDLILKADNVLYEAKNTGRNQSKISEHGQAA